MAKAITMEEFEQGMAEAQKNGNTGLSEENQQRLNKALEKLQEAHSQVAEEYGLTSFTIFSDGNGVGAFTNGIDAFSLANGIAQTLLRQKELYDTFTKVMHHELVIQAAAKIHNYNKDDNNTDE